MKSIVIAALAVALGLGVAKSFAGEEKKACDAGGCPIAKKEGGEKKECPVAKEAKEKDSGEKKETASAGETN